MRKILKEAKRIVIKVGTSTLTYENGKINLTRMEHLARRVADLINNDKQVILVTSGAVGVGMGKLNLSKKPTAITEKQAVASVGQCELMHIYSKLFSEYGIIVGQILLTRTITENEVTKNNAINTFNSLLEKHVLPIVNENDAISTDELVSFDKFSFGDNDTLSSIVAALTNSELLILLSDVDGFYDGDPRKDEEAKVIKVVEKIDDKMMNFVGKSSSKMGTGGMMTKLTAAKMATENHIEVVLANGDDMNNLQKITEGEDVGTWFRKGEKDVY
ncbi:MAG: glutamate 5-kinase [Clostridia bacterium]|nr:glutamate 5-kinase [Clostridia bacterium]